MGNSHYQTRLQGILVVVFIKLIYIQFKMTNTNILLDVWVYSVAVYVYESCRILTGPYVGRVITNTNNE